MVVAFIILTHCFKESRQSTSTSQSNSSSSSDNKFVRDSRRRPLILNDSPMYINLPFAPGYPLEPIAHITSVPPAVITSAKLHKTVEKTSQNGCLPHCACRSDSSASEISANSIGFRRFFGGKAKVSVDQTEIKSAWSEGKAISGGHNNVDSFCSVCTCFLDPVELNDLSPGYTLPTRDDSRVKSFKKTPNPLDCGYHGFHPPMDKPSVNSKQGRNKFNLTIDTSKTQEKGACLTDPMYNMIMNSPIVRKLR